MIPIPRLYFNNTLSKKRKRKRRRENAYIPIIYNNIYIYTVQKEEERRERKNSIVKHDDPALLVTRVHFNDSVTVISEKIRRHERGGSFIFCN